MKRIIALILCLCAVFCLAACGGDTPEAKDPDMASVSKAVSDVALTDEMVQLDGSYISNTIKLGEGDYEDCYVAISSVGTNIDEFGIFRASDESQMAEIEKALNDYLDFKRSAWIDSYLPDQFPKLENAAVHSEGLYVCYFVLGDDTAADALDAFEACFK